MENPKCSICKSYWKSEDNDIKPSGLYYKSCKTCRNRQKKYEDENKGKLLEKRNQRKNKDRVREYFKKFRETYKGRRSQLYQDNKQKIGQYYKKYRELNKQRMSEQRKQNYQSNKCSHKRCKYHCKECNFKKYLIKLQRNRLRRCFNNSNLKKTKRSIEYLGCSAEYFMEYFKKKMDKFNLFSEIEMTWDNIHIDHIKPISVFDLDNEDKFLSCCNYTNLQPLLAVINLQKHDKWNDVSNDFWLKHIINNEDADIYIP